MLRPKWSGRKGGTVYSEPYWFDESKSLRELHGWSSVDDAFAIPVGALSSVQLARLLAGQTEPHYLVPIAIARLGHIGDAERSLVLQLLALAGDFWDSHPYLRAQLAQILEAHLARHPDDDVRPLAADFLQIT